MPSLRLNRRDLSRTSTPALPPGKGDSSPAEDPKKENREKTFLDRWVEPPVKSHVASFEDHGFSRAGLFAQMAPLGQMPSTKLKIRVSTGGHIRKKSALSRGEVLSAMETPVETPDRTPPIEPTQQTEEESSDAQSILPLPSKEEDEDEEYTPKVNMPHTTRQAQVLNGQPPVIPISTPKQSRRGSPLRTPYTGHTLDSVKSSAMSSASRANYSRQELEGIVGGVVSAAARANKPKLGDVTQLLLSEYQRDPVVADILNAIMSQSATQQQFDSFKEIFRNAKRRHREIRKSAKEMARLRSLNGTEAIGINSNTTLLPGFSPTTMESQKLDDVTIQQSPDRSFKRRHTTNFSPATELPRPQSARSSRARNSLPSSHPALRQFSSNPESLTSDPLPGDDMQLRNREYKDDPPVTKPRKRKDQAQAPGSPTQASVPDTGITSAPSASNSAPDTNLANTSNGSKTVASVAQPALPELTAGGTRPRRSIAKPTYPIDIIESDIAPLTSSPEKPRRSPKKGLTSAHVANNSIVDQSSALNSDVDDESLSDVDENLITKLETEQAEIIKPKETRKRPAPQPEVYSDVPSEDQALLPPNFKRAKKNGKGKKVTEAVDRAAPVNKEQELREKALDDDLKVRLKLQFGKARESKGLPALDPSTVISEVEGRGSRFRESTRPNYKEPSPLRQLDDDLEYSAPAPRLDPILYNQRPPPVFDDSELELSEVELNPGNRRSQRDAGAGPVSKRMRAPNAKATTKTSPVKKDGRKENTYAGLAPTTNAQTDANGISEVCVSCGGPGHLVVCEDCDNAFHFACIDPPADADDQEFLDRPFYCAPCTVAMKEVHKAAHPDEETDDEEEDMLRGVWYTLMSTLEATNPAAFALPKKIKTHFMGVEETKFGRYRFHTDKPIQLRAQRRPSLRAKSREDGALTATAMSSDDEAQPESKTWLCATCGLGDHGGRREMVVCDWQNCDNKVHTDHSKIYHGDYSLPDKGPHRWPAYCKMHLGYAVGGSEEPLNLMEVNGRATQVHPVRMLRKGEVMSPEEAKMLDYRNNGNVRVELEDDKAEEDTIRRLDGKIVTVPEKAIINAFWAKGRSTGPARAAAARVQKQTWELFKQEIQDKTNAEFERRVNLEVERRMTLAQAEMREQARLYRAELLGKSFAEQDAARALHQMASEIIAPSVHRPVSRSAEAVKPMERPRTTSPVFSRHKERQSSVKQQPVEDRSIAQKELDRPAPAKSSAVPTSNARTTSRRNAAPDMSQARSQDSITIGSSPPPPGPSVPIAEPLDRPASAPPTNAVLNGVPTAAPSRIPKRKRESNEEETPSAEASNKNRKKSRLTNDIAAITAISSRISTKANGVTPITAPAPGSGSGGTKLKVKVNGMSPQAKRESEEAISPGTVDDSARPRRQLRTSSERRGRSTLGTDRT